MALANYTDLKTAIGTWNFNRTDLPTADLILLAETRLIRDLKLRNTEADAALTGVISARTIALPTGFVSASDCWIEDTWGRDPLAQVLPAIDTVTTVGRPSYWAIDGETLAFERPLDLAYSITLRCQTRLALSDSAPTNWLLTNYPDTYLWAANLEAALWMQDSDLAETAEARYEAARDGVKSIEARSKSPPLRTDIPATGRPFDYYRGF